MMPDSLIRVSIHYVPDGHIDDPTTVDVALPRTITIGELLPSITRACGASRANPASWRLRTVVGAPLHESVTLEHNDIHDGDLLLLGIDGAADAPVDTDAAVAVPTPVPPSVPGPGLRLAGCCWFLLLGALVAGWAGLSGHGPARYGLAAVAAIVVGAAAAITARAGLAAPAVVLVNAAAVVHVATVGFLAVPGGPGIANVFLAAVAGASCAVVLLRLSHPGATVLTALTAGSALLALAAGCAAVWQLGLTALGATLIAAGIGGLSFAPRLTITLAGLAPPPLDSDGSDDVPDVARGHQVLSGLVSGCSGAVAVGMLVLVIGVVTPAAVALTATAAVALTLRSRSYVTCRAPLLLAGLTAATTALVLAVLWRPDHGGWVGAVATLTGLGLLAPGGTAGPLVLRFVDALEYLALAAIVPLSCWLTGVFDLVGGLR